MHATHTRAQNAILRMHTACYERSNTLSLGRTYVTKQEYKYGAVHIISLLLLSIV